jgi:beta-aspartyl-peptidase (threonine type)
MQATIRFTGRKGKRDCYIVAMSALIRMAIHGGAGDASPGRDPSEHRRALRAITEEGIARLREGTSALDAVELLVLRLEECPLFNAGVGAVLNREGQPELDAAIMDGRTRAAGAVAGVMRSQSPIRLARAVMERSPHVLFAGSGAEALGRELGLPEVTPDHFVTEERFHQLKLAHAKGVIVLDQDSAFGTVGAVARDRDGNLAAATSTGGLTNKHPGRIGDSPIVGAGTYADNRSLAVSCTGTGECFIRSVFGYQVHARMLFARESLADASREALDDMRSLGGKGGCIAISRDGEVALPFNSQQMYRAWVGADGCTQVAVGED